MHVNSIRCNQQQGFTLLELAVVLMIIGILLGGFITTLSSRIEQSQREQTKKQLEEIKSGLLGYASANGRLPCPTTTTGAGREQPVGGGVCVLQNGFIPGRTLGLDGSYNRDGLLLDSWGNPIRYSVTASNGSAFTAPYTPGNAGPPAMPATGIKAVGMSALTPNLTICNGDSASNIACSAGLTTLTANVPFVVLSLGKDGSNFTTTVGANRVFVSRSYGSAGAGNGQFDDIIVWVSPFVLYSRMIEAGQLP